MPRLRHKGRIALAVLFAVTMLVAITLPFWFSALLRPLLAQFGASYGTYQTKGISQFVLRDVSYKTNGIQVTAQTVRGLSPYAWLWRLGTHAPTVFVQVENW